MYLNINDFWIASRFVPRGRNDVKVFLHLAFSSFLAEPSGKAERRATAKQSRKTQTL